MAGGLDLVIQYVSRLTVTHAARQTGDGALHTARAVVDATGRAAVLARLHGLQPARHDRLVSCFAFCENRTPDDNQPAEAHDRRAFIKKVKSKNRDHNGKNQ